MTEITETIKNNPIAQKVIELIADGFSNETYRSQSQKEKTTSIHRTLFEEAILLKGRTFENMEKKTELNENKTTFSAKTRRFT